MFIIKEVKKEGSFLLKRNFWTLIFLGLFMSLVVGRYLVNNDAMSSAKALYDYVSDDQEDNIEEVEYMVNEVADKFISESLTGNITSLINVYNKEHNVTKGVIYGVCGFFTRGQLQLQNLIHSIVEYEDKERAASILLIVGSVLGFIIRVFLVYPIRVGETRIYLESIHYPRTKIRRIIYAFRRNRYFGSIKTLLLMEMRKFLWNLTIIGGIIKTYSYKMVPFIIAENPSVRARDAIKISCEMMNGNKLQTFKLDLSFIGWIILQIATFGLAGIVISPYYTATYTMLYEKLRKEYIEKHGFQFEALNDTKLFEENELVKYPDPYEIKRKTIKIDYSKSYEFSSIVIFFFVFSFVGWIWEVLLYLFRDGIMVNRGTLHGPWLPIYGFGCSFMILLTQSKRIRKMLKNPTITFVFIMIVCSIIEYVTSWYIERASGLKYWDYTGIFMNLHGRICLECSLFFGFGGSVCVYIVAPLLERMIQHVTSKVKLAVCMILTSVFMIDNVYSIKNPNTGEGITTSAVAQNLNKS